MQPQDQNYQSDDQTSQVPVDDGSIANAEQLESAPAPENQAVQPPLTPFVDGNEQPQASDNIPEVPDLSVEAETAAPTQQPETDHLAEPPSQDDELNTGFESPAPAYTPPEEQTDNFASEVEQAVPTSEETIIEATPTQEPGYTSEDAPTTPAQDQQPIIEPSLETPTEDLKTQLGEVVDQSTPENNQLPEEPISSPEIAAEQPVEMTSSEPPSERVSLTDHGSFEPQAPQPIANETAVPTEEKENIYTEICSEIIKEQEQIIGTLAVEQANNVEGLSVDPATYHCTVTGDGSKVIDDLIEQYRDFFGHAAVEVCKEAASRFLARLPAEELPTSLR